MASIVVGRGTTFNEHLQWLQSFTETRVNPWIDVYRVQVIKTYNSETCEYNEHQNLQLDHIKSRELW